MIDRWTVWLFWLGCSCCIPWSRCWCGCLAFTTVPPRRAFRRIVLGNNDDVLLWHRPKFAVLRRSATTTTTSDSLLSSPSRNDTTTTTTTITTNPTTTNPTTTRIKTRSKDIDRRIPFSKDYLQSLQESIDLVSLMESFGLEQLEKKQTIRGIATATAICPFHDDHHPSLSIDSSRGIFKCFACGAGGNVFGFLQQIYQVRGRPISFLDAVRIAQQWSPNQTIITAPPNLSTSFDTPLLQQQQPRRQQHVEEEMKQRIYAANAAAAAFYFDSLTRRPWGGGARFYLTQTRLFSKHVIPQFSLGFAPDTNHHHHHHRSNNPTTSGSLVQYLDQLNFTAQEMIHAGLAMLNKFQLNSTNNNNNTLTEQYNVHSLVDRFRNRIMIPIFDDSGKRIVGFAGRLLPNAPQDKEIPARTPKYLNSPQTLTFFKQQILFGQQQLQTSTNTVVLVEGYLDAIAVASVGISNVLATMGTAVSHFQLERAARIVNPTQDSQNIIMGTVILCMDNDEAGLLAVKRLVFPRGGGDNDEDEEKAVVASFIDQYPQVQFLVASLAEPFKDPSELVEHYQKLLLDEKDVKNRVQNELLDSALPWSHWCIRQIVKEGMGTMKNITDQMGTQFVLSTEVLLDQLARFLSRSYFSLPDRSKLVPWAVHFLLSAIFTNSTTPELQETREQLETNLLDRVRQIQLLRNITRTLTAEDMASKQSTGEWEILEYPAHPCINRSDSPHGINPSDSPTEVFLDSRENQQGQKMVKNSKQRQQHLTPHYNGIKFAHPADAIWCQSMDGASASSVRGGTFLPQLFSDNGLKSEKHKKQRAVYFNSNLYHGHKLLTDEAREAGYTNRGSVKKDHSIFFKGVGLLVQPDTWSMTLDAETALLRALILNPAARIFFKNLFPNAFGWTCPQKAWLSQVLLDQSQLLGSPKVIRQHLMNRKDVPDGAFSRGDNYPVEDADQDKPGVMVVPNSDSKQEGVLEELFVDTKTREEELSLSSSTNLEYYLRYLSGTLEWTWAKQEMELLRSEIDQCCKENGLPDPQSLPAEKDPDDELVNSTMEPANRPEVTKDILELITRFQKVALQIQSIEESQRQTSIQAFSLNSSLKAGEKAAASDRAKLRSQVKEFEPVLARRYPKSSYLAPGEVSFETFDQQVDERWGEWSQDDYVWSPDKAAEKQIPPADAPVPVYEYDNEPNDAEEVLLRLDREYRDFL